MAQSCLAAADWGRHRLAGLAGRSQAPTAVEAALVRQDPDALHAATDPLRLKLLKPSARCDHTVAVTLSPEHQRGDRHWCTHTCRLQTPDVHDVGDHARLLHAAVGLRTGTGMCSGAWASRRQALVPVLLCMMRTHLLEVQGTCTQPVLRL